MTMLPPVSRRVLRGVLFRTSFLLTVLALLVPIPASAQVFNGRFITSVYAWKQFDTVNVSTTLARGFLSALFDVTQGDVSLHTHMQAASMFAKSMGGSPDYHLYNLYVRWKDIGKVADLSVGRLPYFAGVGNGTVDGALATVRTSDRSIRFSAYGGANVPMDLDAREWGPLKNNFTVGAQFVTTAIPDVRLGISYVNKVRSRPGYWAARPDSAFNAITQFIELDPLKEQLLGADLGYWMEKLYFYGRYDYNVNTKETQRGQAGVRYSPTEKVSFSADFIHRAPRVLYNSFFTVFNTSDVNEIEAGIDYLVKPTVRVFVRGGSAEYVDDTSLRYTVGLAHSYGSLTYRGGSGYAGELNSVSLEATYPLYDYRFMPAIGATYYSYKLNAAAKREQAFAGVLGATIRPVQAFSVDLQGQLLTNRVYKDDVRLFAKVNYWFSQRLNIFE